MLVRFLIARRAVLGPLFRKPHIYRRYYNLH